jgi:hypothetical protein
MDTLGELKPESCEYVGADEVRVTLKTKTGYTLTAAMLVHSVQPVGGIDQQLHRPGIQGSSAARTA